MSTCNPSATIVTTEKPAMSVATTEKPLATITCRFDPFQLVDWTTHTGATITTNTGATIQFRIPI